MQDALKSENVHAMVWMIGAIVAFTTMAIAGRAVSDVHDTFEIMLFRSLIGVGIVVSLGAYFKNLHQINRERLGLHFARNLAHFAGQNLWFFALPLIPLAQLFALEFTGPLWVLLLAPIFLGETLTKKKLSYAALGFVGILIVAKPEFGVLNIGVLTGALAAVGFAFTAIFTRKLTRTESITCILFWLTFLQAIFGFIGVIWDGTVTWPTQETWVWLIIIGLAGLVAHYCLTTALSLAPASIVMPIDFVRLPLIACIGMIFYSETLDAWLILGASLILLGNYLNVTRAN